MTKSRSAYLGLLFAAILLAWRERAHFPARKILIASIFVVAAVAGLAAIAAASGHLDKKVLTESTKSLTYRVEYWRGAWGMITDGRLRWLTGVGPGNFGGPYLQHKLPQASEEISDPHNFLLEVWATAGLPALIAIVISLIVGLRASFGPSSNPEDADDPSNEPQPVAKWLVFVGGLGGFSLVMTLGRLNPFSGDDFSRLVILAAGWSLAVLLGASLWKRVPLTSDALGLGVVAIVINLLAAGGVGFAPVSLMMWGLLALALNLREDRACSQRRDVGDRGLSFVVMAIVAAAIGTYIGTVLPFWRAQSAMSEAETALTSVIADPKRADAAYLRAIMVDVYGSRSRIARAFLEYREWQRRGSPPEDFTWHRIDSGLLSALKPPLNPDNLAVQRLRAKIAREFLDLPNLIPAERLRIRNDRLDASRAACNLYPADATLRADLAEAYADLNKFPEALDEGRLALELDAANPHKDKKLRDVQRKRLESAMETWKAM